jgi:hypothetical protein
MKHQKIKLVLSLDNSNEKKIFSTISTFLGPFFKFFRKSHFFQELSILACRPHDIRNPLIESNKKKKKI